MWILQLQPDTYLYIYLLLVYEKYKQTENCFNKANFFRVELNSVNVRDG